MKVELLVTLKGKDRWKKGLILDSEKAPIPSDILAEINQNKRTVKVLEGDLLSQPTPPENNVDVIDEATEGGVNSFDIANVTTDLLSESNPEEQPASDGLDTTDTSTETIETSAEPTPENQETEKSAENTIECDICHRPFSSPKGLKGHKTKMHSKKK
ncbi:C2H2-type zinc finger protein [Candidatus Pacearchaeota archaeon]|nr:C2H2-type zinc finger protein [Candidatus Pacearchaeota archaeon]